MGVLLRLLISCLAIFVVVRSDLQVSEYIEVLDAKQRVEKYEQPEMQIGEDYGKSNVVDPMPLRMDPGFKAVEPEPSVGNKNASFLY